MIKQDVHNRLKGASAFGDPNLCKTLFGSEFYTQLLNTVKECLRDDFIEETYLEPRQKVWEENLSFSFDSLRASERPEDNAVVALDHGSELFKALREKYNSIPTESIHLKSEVNQMLILGGMMTKFFMQLLDEKGDKGPQTYAKDVFAQFGIRCQTLQLLQHHHMERPRLPTSIMYYVSNKVLQKKDVSIIETGGPAKEMFIGGYKELPMWKNNPGAKPAVTFTFAPWMFILIVIILIYAFV